MKNTTKISFNVPFELNEWIRDFVFYQKTRSKEKYNIQVVILEALNLYKKKNNNLILAPRPDSEKIGQPFLLPLKDTSTVAKHKKLLSVTLHSELNEWIRDFVFYQKTHNQKDCTIQNVVVRALEEFKQSAGNVKPRPKSVRMLE